MFFIVLSSLQIRIKEQVSGRDAPSLLTPRSTLTFTPTSAKIMEDISTKAYGQWVVIHITNSSTKTLVIKNVRLSWGKFHEDDNKDYEIALDDIENTKIRGGKQFTISSCGRSDAPSGTEGEFDIYENGGEKVGHYYWDCPWGGNGNIWKITERNAKWAVKSSGGNLKRGALGDISVEVTKKGP